MVTVNRSDFENLDFSGVFLFEFAIVVGCGLLFSKLLNFVCIVLHDTGIRQLNLELTFR